MCSARASAGTISLPASPPSPTFPSSMCCYSRARRVSLFLRVPRARSSSRRRIFHPRATSSPARSSSCQVIVANYRPASRDSERNGSSIVPGRGRRTRVVGLRLEKLSSREWENQDFAADSIYARVYISTRALSLCSFTRCDGSAVTVVRGDLARLFSDSTEWSRVINPVSRSFLVGQRFRGEHRDSSTPGNRG